MPAFSRAVFNDSRVLTLAAGTPSDNSNLLIVEIPTPDKMARSAAVIFSKALAALNCALVNNTYCPYNDTYSFIYGFYMANNTSKYALNKTIEMIEGAYAPSTIRAYSKNFERFIEYCNNENLPALPSEPFVVANYIQKLSLSKLKSASIRLAVAAISSIHQLNLYPDPTAHPTVKIELKRMHRTLGRASKQAYGITLNTLNQMIAQTKSNMSGIRNRALLMVAYDSMCRRSELVSLRIEDCQIDKERTQIKVKLKRSKTDQDGLGKILFLREETQEVLIEWLSLINENSGYIFRGINHHNTIKSKLTPGQINRIYKQLAKLAKLEDEITERISGHSLRVGAAQDLLLSGASMPVIMNRGRWSKVDTVMKYMEQATY